MVKKTPKNWSTNVLKKIYLGRVRVHEFFSTTLNDQIFFSSRALKKYYISIYLCILVGNTRKHPKIGVPMSSKKYIWVGFGFSNFFSTPRNDRIFLFSRALNKYYISLNFCILVSYIKTHPKIGVPMSSKKFIRVGFGFSNFFPLLETSEFFFLLGLLKSIISA